MFVEKDLCFRGLAFYLAPPNHDNDDVHNDDDVDGDDVHGVEVYKYHDVPPTLLG